MLATKFANANILTVMQRLEPTRVSAWVAGFNDSGKGLVGPASAMRGEAETMRMGTVWHAEVANPATMLGETMQQLSVWGTPTAVCISCSWGAALCCMPIVVHDTNIHTLQGTVFLVFLVMEPLLVAFAPALVGTHCNNLLEQLNDISFLVSSSCMQTASDVSSILTLHCMLDCTGGL